MRTGHRWRAEVISDGRDDADHEPGPACWARPPPTAATATSRPCASLCWQARLGRRINEICLLDPDPLLPLARCPGTPRPDHGDDGQASVAKLRYQQTKIDGAPDTILVDAEVVAIIRAQQQWAAAWLPAHARAGRAPKYLFLAPLFNRNGDRPYSPHPAQRADRAGRRLDIRDTPAAGRLQPDPPVPAHQGHQPAQRRGPDPRRAALPGSFVARDDHALRPDPGRDPRSRVPAVPQAHRRRPRGRDRCPRSLRHAAAGPADRPDPAQRVVPAAAAAILRPRERLPDV